MQHSATNGPIVQPSIPQYPRISVVTPSFNQADYLEATLRSVITQRYPELEYVVVDGGSRDGSVDIIERYAAHLTFWTSEADGGHADALNKGFAKTTGEIMCWINSSDMQYPWTLHTVAEIFSQLPQVDWIAGVPSLFDAAGRPRAVAFPRRLNIYDVLAGDYRWIQQESVFWRRRLWERAGGRVDAELTCASDFELWLRFFRSARLYSVSTVLAGYRIHDDRLGEAGDGLYEREAKQAHSRFVVTCRRSTLARARLISLVGRGRRRLLSEGLAKLGLLPWYRHPSINYDFDHLKWVAR